MKNVKINLERLLHAVPVFSPVPPVRIDPPASTGKDPFLQIHRVKYPPKDPNPR